VFESFLKAGVVDEIYLTVEPVELGAGVPLLKSGQNLEEVVDLPEPEISEMNAGGTILKHFYLKK